MVSAEIANNMSSLEDELEFDMWDGQFEFLGDSYVSNGEPEPAADDSSRLRPPANGYDPTADLVLAPISIEEAVQNISASRAGKHSKMNLKKNPLFDDMSDNVSDDPQAPL